MNEEISRIDINNVNYKLKDEDTRLLGEMGKQALIKVGYYVCSTQGSTAAKTISAADYTLSAGGCIKVKMDNANTAENATLNINSTGAKPLYYDGNRASATNTWEAGETVEVYYDGTSYYANNVAGGSGIGDGAFDVSAKYPTSGVGGGNTYTLAGALAVLNANLSASKKKGGMNIKFIQSSDNKYVQYRLSSPTWSTDIHDWTSEDPYFVDRIMQEVNEAIDEHTPIEITGNVTNAPDEEDLTSVNAGGTNVLKFKDKAYNQLTYSGMGRKILRKNIVNGTNILTQSMVSQSNTIYIIQYDYDLGGTTITLPVGCVLEFDGGSVKNGVISGRNTVINANPVKIFNTDIELSGTWKIKEVYPEWWGAVGDGIVDCTNSIKQSINCITAMQNIEIYPGEGTPAGCILQFGAGVYLISESGILSSYARRTRGFWLKGISKEATMLKIDDAGNENTMWFFDNESSPVLGTLSKIYIENISFASTNKMCGGFKMRSAGFEKQLKIRNFAFVGKKFLEFYGTGNADLSVIENSSINVYNGGYVITAENAQSVFHRFVNTEISAVEADVVKKNLGGSIYFENCNIETHSAPNSANTTKYFIVRDTGGSVAPSESKISFHCCRFELWNKAGYYKGTDDSYYSSIITFDDCSMFNTDIESTDYQFYIRNNQKVICTNCVMPLRTRVNIGVTSDVATMSLPIFVSTDCDWYRNEIPDVFQMNGDVARIIVRRGTSTNAGSYRQAINTFDVDYGYEYLNNYNIPPALKLFCWPATYISTLRLNGNATHTQTVNFSSLQKLISIDFSRIGGNVSALFSYHLRWRIYGILRIDDSEILLYDSGSMEKTYADSFSASVLINSNKYKSIKLIQEKEESGWTDGIVGDIALNISYI